MQASYQLAIVDTWLKLVNSLLPLFSLIAEISDSLLDHCPFNRWHIQKEAKQLCECLLLSGDQVFIPEEVSGNPVRDLNLLLQPSYLCSNILGYIFSPKIRELLIYFCWRFRSHRHRGKHMKHWWNYVYWVPHQDYWTIGHEPAVIPLIASILTGVMSLGNPHSPTLTTNVTIPVEPTIRQSHLHVMGLNVGTCKNTCHIL